MNRFAKLFIVSFIIAATSMFDAAFAPLFAGIHYRLWVWDGRYGGWGWSRPVDIFGRPWFRVPDTVLGAYQPRCQYWYPAYTNAYFYPALYSSC